MSDPLTIGSVPPAGTVRISTNFAEAESELAAVPGSDLESDPHQSEDYQRFVASMVPHCQCRANNCPCDGVLAGGPCDMIQEEESLPIYDDDEE